MAAKKKVVAKKRAAPPSSSSGGTAEGTPAKKRRVAAAAAPQQQPPPPSCLGTALFGGLRDAVNSGTAAATVRRPAADAAMDSLAEEVFGLSTLLLGEAAPPAQPSFVLLPDAPSTATLPSVALPPHAAVSLYGATPAAALLLPAPAHLAGRLDGFFDTTQLGVSLIDPETCTPQLSAHVLLAKPAVEKGSDEGGGAGSVCLPEEVFGGRDLLVFMVDEDATLSFARPSAPAEELTLGTGQAAYHPHAATAGGGLRRVRLSTPEGCAVLLVSFACASVGAFAGAVAGRPELLDAAAAFDPAHTAQLLRLCREYAEAAAAGDAGSSALGSAHLRHPLLPGSLHAEVSPQSFLRVAAETLRGGRRWAEPAAAAAAADGSSDNDARLQRLVASSEGGVEAFLREGVACVEADAAAAPLLAEARAFVLRESAALAETDALTDEAVRGGQQYFPVHYRKRRQDMGQRLDGGPCERLLRRCLGKLGVAARLEAILGPSARLVEFSCLLSHPGSMGQPPHSDSTARTLAATSHAHLVSCFMPLVDVTDAMGPLEVWPGTHAAAQLLGDSLSMLRSASGGAGGFREFLSEEEELAAGAAAPAAAAATGSLAFDSVRMTVPAGSVVLMDSRCYHRGSANKSSSPRPVLYFTFASEGGSLPVGSTYSLMPELKRRRLVLRDFAADPVARRVVRPQALKTAVAPLDAERRALLDAELHKGCAASIIDRVPAATARGGAEEGGGGGGGGDVHDSVCDAQTQCIEAHAECEDPAGAESLAQTVGWLKSAAAFARVAGERAAAAAAPLRTVVHPAGGTGAAGGAEAAKVAHANGQAVGVEASASLAAAAAAWAGAEAEDEAAASAAAKLGAVYLLPGAAASPVLCTVGGGRSVVVCYAGSAEVVQYGVDEAVAPVERCCGAGAAGSVLRCVAATPAVGPTAKWAAGAGGTALRAGEVCAVPAGRFYRVRATPAKDEAEATTIVVVSGSFPPRGGDAASTATLSRRRLSQALLGAWRGDRFAAFSALPALRSPVAAAAAAQAATRYVVSLEAFAAAAGAASSRRGVGGEERLWLSPAARLLRIGGAGVHEQLPRPQAALRAEDLEALADARTLQGPAVYLLTTGCGGASGGAVVVSGNCGGAAYEAALRAVAAEAEAQGACDALGAAPLRRHVESALAAAPGATDALIQLGVLLVRAR